MNVAALQSLGPVLAARTQPRLSRRSFVAATTAAMLHVAVPRVKASTPPTASELVFASVSDLSRWIRAKEVSAEEVVKAYLERIEAVNPAINAIVTLAAERSLEEARAADAELARGHIRGFLHGVPMTVKDSFDTAGIVSTAGTQGRRSFVPRHDATVVERLRSAGAILLGKTNTPIFTMSYDTRNLLFGVTKNPYNLSNSPGGSSGGAAAAIAAGASPLDIGSDTGGSIRVPSCFCGIAGIKPTTGRMPLTGHIIRTGQSMGDPLTQVGPMARQVNDLFPLFKIMAGPDGKDPAVVPMPLEYPLKVELKELRVAFHTDNGIMPADDDVARIVRAAADVLAGAGARVEESCPKVLARFTDIGLRPLLVDGGQWLRRLLKESGTTQWDPELDWHQQLSPFSGEEIEELLRAWHRFRAEMLAWMSRYDLLVCPVNARASWPSGFGGGGSMDAFTYTSAYNVTGWPAAVVRGGTSDAGMPIGVQVVSRPWCEHLCLAAAGRLEAALGGWQRPSI